MGFSKESLESLRNLLNRPNGLLLVTGPTGAGKSTTLYGCLHYLNDGHCRIITIEDPIEREMPGIRQSQVHPEYDSDFPVLLRSVLRQAPDVVMIGEIRDATTAETAVRAANSGHLVLATIHAAFAAGCIDTMLCYGVHPRFLASSLLARSRNVWFAGCATAARRRKTCRVCLWRWRTIVPGWMPRTSNKSTLPKGASTVPTTVIRGGWPSPKSCVLRPRSAA